MPRPAPALILLLLTATAAQAAPQDPAPATATATTPGDDGKPVETKPEIPAKGAKPKIGNGTIMYVTSKEAYMNVGGDNGLPPAGTKVKVFRRKRLIGECEIVEVTIERARCKSDRVATGDTFTFPITKDSGAPTKASVASQAQLKQEKREPLPSQRELASLRELVAAKPVELVPFRRGPGGLGISSRAAATLRQEFWSTSTRPDGGVFARTSVDLSGRVGLGVFFASTALRISGDFLAPPEQRFRNGEQVEIYLWNASLGVGGDSPVVGELGRFRPRLVPGATLIDGLQLGARFLGAEVGVYGGVIPDLATVLEPRFNRVTGGLYTGLDLNVAPGVFVLPRARVSFLGDVAGIALPRGEAEVQTQVFWAEVMSLGGSVRASAGEDFVPSVDAARADVSISLTDAFKLSADYRFLGAPVVDYEQLGIVPPALAYPLVGGAHHGSATVSYAFGGGAPSSSLAYGNDVFFRPPPTAPQVPTPAPDAPAGDAAPPADATTPATDAAATTAAPAGGSEAKPDAKDAKDAKDAPAATTAPAAPAAAAASAATGEREGAADVTQGPDASGAVAPGLVGQEAPALPFLVVGATGGGGYDVVREISRYWAGPELGLPTAFGAWGGLDVGYLEELGDWPGRSAWLTATIRPLAQLRVVTRVSYFDIQDEIRQDQLREMGLMTLVDAPITPWLGIRGRAYGQQVLPNAKGSKQATPTLLMVDLAVTGSL